LYGGSLTLITMADSFRSVRPTVRLRLTGVVAVGAAAVIVALVTSSDFLTNFGNFLSTLLYFMIPWTAVNLVDFYFVRKGQYAVREIFNPNGIYGRWGWRGLTAYFAGFAASIPFFSTGLYTGPVAKELGGADIAIFIGLPVAAIVYLLLGRGIDLERERRVAAETTDELEREPPAHERPVEIGV
jgi:purine-cytosine permease-like protein